MAVGNSKKLGGFTLVELLVTLAIGVILLTVAIPSFQEIVAKNRVDTEYYQMMSGLKFARSEALKRRQPVTAVITPGADGNGWRLEVKLDNGANLGAIDCSNVDEPNCLMVRNREDTLPAISISNTNVTFNAVGRLISGGGSVQVNVTYNSKAQGVCVELSGNVVGRSCA